MRNSLCLYLFLYFIEEFGVLIILTKLVSLFMDKNVRITKLLKVAFL